MKRSATGDLFDYAFTRSRAGDPDTSHAAAEGVVLRLNEIQTKVLRYARKLFPLAFTDLDLEAHFDNHGATYRTRRSELVDKDLIEDTRQRRFQEGSYRVLWRAKPWQ